MSIMQSKLKVWLLELCKNDNECEKKLRGLLRQDKVVLREINIAYRESNLPRVQGIIKKFISNNGILIRTCKNCHKANFIHKANLIGLKCVKCSFILLKPSNKESTPIKSNQEDKNARTCLYCNNPVSALPNSFTCLSCRGVGFSLY